MSARNVTERVRLHRLRKRAGEIVMPHIAVSFETIDVLVETGQLAQWDAEDPEKVAEAVKAMLDDLRTAVIHQNGVTGCFARAW